MLTTALYLKYAIKTLSRILLIFLSNGLIIMTCVSIRLRPKKWLCFRRDRTFVDSLPYIFMNGNYIERPSQEKILCVTILSDLSWNAHVSEIISKARKRVYISYQLKRDGINQNDLIIIYVSVIRPVVEYATCVAYELT